MLSFKLLVLGDNGVGRTSLMLTAFGEGFPKTEFVPSVFDSYQSNRLYKTKSGKHIPVNIYVSDEFYREDSARLRPLSYPGTHAIVLCYPAVAHWKQTHPLKSIRETWMPEIKKWAEGVPIIFVRTKCDLETSEPIPFPEKQKETYWYNWTENPNKRYDNSIIVSMEEAESLSKEMGAVGHYRVSALSGEGIKEAVDTILHTAYTFHQDYPSGSPQLTTQGNDVLPGKLGAPAVRERSNRCILS